MTDKHIEEMSEQELDQELRSFGIDPAQVVQNAFSKLCVVLRQKSQSVRDLTQALQEINRTSLDTDYSDSEALAHVGIVARRALWPDGKSRGTGGIA